ncbi:hypothetical protein GCM10027160_52740 [Streptomyces calidiresistens]|uniref:Excreted virulence factor EspC (Type VII ESX diderm) n=1 Tax=Streptomyces calidiresistens TaxID=1485586 RepID=A0A7W3XXF5_9ACTN|nr:hypothetical protein [Streptomyces calidiresistens]MBB0230767.1 hypothetical protein [Streptomyces calidiresistens]
MSDNDLKVPYEMLEEFGEELESVRTRMNATGRTVENYEDDIGDSSVRKALEDFVSNWRDGRQRIDDQLTALKEIADMVVEEFSALDREYEASLEGNAEGPPAPGGEQTPI